MGGIVVVVVVAPTVDDAIVGVVALIATIVDCG